MEINKYFLTIINKYTWEDQKKTEMIFGLCEEFEKNSKKSEIIIINILKALVYKYHFNLLNTKMHRV